MKRTALLHHLQAHGCVALREGGNHSIWTNPQTRRKEAAENRKQEVHKWNVLLAQAKVDNQELQNMRLETPEHRIHGRVERILAAENAA